MRENERFIFFWLKSPFFHQMFAKELRISILTIAYHSNWNENNEKRQMKQGTYPYVNTLFCMCSNDMICQR